MDEYGADWDEAKRRVFGGRFDVGRTQEIEDLREDERAFLSEGTRMKSSAPDPADWRSTSMMGLELESSGIKETEALAYAHERYKHSELGGFMDGLIGSRMPSMKDIQDVYEAMAEAPFPRLPGQRARQDGATLRRGCDALG